MQLNELNEEILAGLTGQERADFEAGLQKLSMANADDRGSLRQSIRNLRPDYTEAQLDAFCGVQKKTELPPARESFKPHSDWDFTGLIEATDIGRQNFLAQVAYAYQDLNAGMGQDDVAEWVRDNEKRIDAKRKEEGFGGDTVKQLVSAIVEEDKEREEEAELPKALKNKYPDWTPEKRARWLAKREVLIQAYKGLNPDWDATQLITAVDGSVT